MDRDALDITETWLTVNMLDLTFLCEVTPAGSGYSFHYAAWIHKKGGEVGICMYDSLKCETHLHFQAFENYQMTFCSCCDKYLRSHYLLITSN